MTAVNETEAAVVRDLANRALNGESLSSLARSLNNAGIQTARGFNPKTGKVIEWTQTSVRSMLLGLHLTGVREYRGERFKAQWPAILDAATHEALVLKLTDPSRRTSFTSSRKYLLSGLATCGECGTPLRATIRKRDRKDQTARAVYRCTNHACLKVLRGAVPVDEMVTEYVVARLTEIDARTGLLVSDADNRRLAALTEERDEIPAKRKRFAARMAAETMSESAYDAAAAALDEREAELTRAIGLLAATLAAPARALDGATGPDAAAVWAGWTEDTTGAGLARQRAIVSLLVDVAVLPSKGGNVFRPESVRITYRDLS